VGASVVLQLIWRFRFSILLIIFAASTFVAWKIWVKQHDEIKTATAAVVEAQRINGDMAKALDLSRAAREYSEATLAKSLARKTKEADRLAALVQRVSAEGKSNACATSPSVRALLDGLRNSKPGSVPQ